ncbi:hypothetical protein [Moorena sp. SIO2C4]|uniref:hypothetical protein n=1 Tax=Moorena sp. SIO2C4 TaxID=2607824 RepID=UPI0013CBDE4D|nr:hypothetical protein [Moorena sp. SIO2C4]NES40915.1 hypothetical protein [Moorena sp. SIO2C4]
MANIEVKNIKPAGAELFADSEGFMNELSSDDLGQIIGGARSSKIIVKSEVKTACPVTNLAFKQVLVSSF